MRKFMEGFFMKIESMDAAMLQSVRTQNSDHCIDARESKNVTNSDKQRVTNKDAQKNENMEYYISERAVVKAIEKANKALVMTKTQLEFSIHEKTKEIMVKVIDSDTKEIIREIPPEKILDMVAKMLELTGILVDERR